MPAPRGNKYAARHGVRAFLTNGTLPEGCGRISGQIGRFRTTLESELVRRKGELTLYDAAVCQSAMRFETVVLLWERW
ncbi:MAG: hypothetical protein JNM18_11180, partial [Planctomycetaceae bacterium]|nr:hypothetical protein [Planctomycetaceae bacterium]